MIWLSQGCSAPRAPVAEGVLSVCCVCECLVLGCAAVCAAGPEDCCTPTVCIVLHGILQECVCVWPVCSCAFLWIRSVSFCLQGLAADGPLRALCFDRFPGLVPSAVLIACVSVSCSGHAAHRWQHEHWCCLQSDKPLIWKYALPTSRQPFI
jgi:hypothetical protein